ncbi:NAD(FAD)-dependent dehydrogenase [Macrococcus sp. IME1552]|nr:NAD(FAD)-dependent dehydrogenase [Macrococcus sp. IME1552]
MSKMDLMWVSFYSLGLMLLAMMLIYVARFKVKNKILNVIVTGLAYIALILSALLMFVVLGGSSHG